MLDSSALSQFSLFLQLTEYYKFLLCFLLESSHKEHSVLPHFWTEGAEIHIHKNKCNILSYLQCQFVPMKDS